MAHSVDLREAAVRLYEESGRGYRVVAKELGISPRTLQDWLYRKRRGESLEPGKPPGRRAVIHEAAQKRLLELIEEHDDWTQQRYADTLNAEFPDIKVSQPVVSLTLKRLGITLKKKEWRACELREERVRKLTVEFLIKRDEYHVQELVFVDESGINVNMARKYGYSPRGQRLYGYKPGQFARNYTVIGALDIKGLSTVMMVNGGTTIEVFFEFARQMLIPTMEPGQVVVMDNLAAHRNKRVIELFHDHGIHVLHTPPYSPEWNPIEWAWSKVKTAIRASAARTLETLEIALKAAADSITPEDAANYFAACGYPDVGRCL